MRPESLHGLSESVFLGHVMHRRKFDVAHAFRYPLWMTFALLPDGGPPSSLPWLARPRWRRYLSRARIQSLVGETLHEDTRIWLLTQPSLLGRSFNPVSFYFVARGGQIRWIVTHITNTPWDEDHAYVLEPQDGHCWRFDKTFHVSPFMPMALAYAWRFRLQDGRIDIDMHLFKQQQRVFFATLNLQAHQASTRRALLLRLSYPLQNLRTLVRIYYQAAILKLKGAQFHAHPDRTVTR